MFQVLPNDLRNWLCRNYLAEDIATDHVVKQYLCNSDGVFVNWLVRAIPNDDQIWTKNLDLVLKNSRMDLVYELQMDPGLVTSRAVAVGRTDLYPVPTTYYDIDLDFLSASRRGDLTILQYLLPRMLDSEITISRWHGSIANSIHWQFMKWIQIQHGSRNWVFSKLVDTAVTEERVDILEWLHNNGYLFTDEHYTLAADYDSFPSLLYLIQNTNARLPVSEYGEPLSEDFYDLSQHELQWILDNDPRLTNLQQELLESMVPSSID